ncbi:nitroreductase family deazaflavin-dependent oxidoreductase [Streptomyces sp. PTM05]|uniref:Nitroreductase family deazaflavin-dependent oxidoreductase n=1 Tax=Streptantibioticus parmotrematis TaxID=2873249 RepID=A0ABS7R1V3_9ACTN|nr:nitroreductase family deazaflavin-dependent oxidoreductase [Streptantibioticus parmotrematis]MBY8889449.1 nitroreductase family deazaflavin-dependent oxidoreductase [Streptantibioticus parmotrematis]
MAHRFKDVSSPSGLLRLAARAPVHLYRWRLGWLLGTRVLLLTHTGRVSGKPRQVVLEVVAHDAQADAYLVASGFGGCAQWYRNIERTPLVTVDVGGRCVSALAKPLSPEESGRAMARYAARHPRTARKLMRICGIEVDGTVEDYYLVGRDYVPFVRLNAVPTLGR